MPSSSLADLSLASVSELLQGFGSSLQGESRDAIHALLKVLEQGLRGTLDYGYYLSAIDPGVGKTLSVSTFLRTWKEQGFCPSSSVLIGLSRLEEIGSYLSNSGLTREDVAVLTSDSERNALGVPSELHGNARVLFTTQQMIERRTRGLSFSEASEFHFQGRPRTLRIWDESFIPAEQLTLRADDLARLPAALRQQHPKFIKEVGKLTKLLSATQDREKVVVPVELEELLPAAKAIKDPQLRDISETLRRLVGREVTVLDMGNEDLHLVGSSSPIPPDLAPVVILDASGRVRSTYSVWESAGAPLRRLPAAVKDYRNLHAHLWERRVGKVSFQQPAVREEVAEAVAEVIANDLTSSWLIISYKDPSIEGTLRKALKQLEPEGGLHFLTWGMHHGTNAYKHCKKVVLIGQLTYTSAGYAALAAAVGNNQDADPAASERLLKGGEYRHHWLQALTRAHVRNSRGDLAGACTAYVIASPGIETTRLMMETFPGCTVDTWIPSRSKLDGHVGALISLLDEARNGGTLPLTKKGLRETLEVNGPNFSRLLSHHAVQFYLDRHAMRVRKNEIDSRTGFKLWPEGGFSIEDLEEID